MSKALQKGIDALVFLSSMPSAGVTEIAKAIGIDKSTAFRIMETLKASNFVEKNFETSKYKIGPAILNLSTHFYSSRRVIGLSRQYLKKLSAVTQESVHLAILSNYSAVIIEQILSDQRVVVNAQVGKMEPLHCSSVGKCLLAFMDDDERDATMAELSLERYTERTAGSAEELIERLKVIRENGYAVDDRELSDEIICVAAPVFSGSGKCAYSLGISGTANKMKNGHLTFVIDNLIKAAEAISYELGYVN